MFFCINGFVLMINGVCGTEEQWMEVSWGQWTNSSCANPFCLIDKIYTLRSATQNKSFVRQNVVCTFKY